MKLNHAAGAAGPICWIITIGNPQRGDDGIGPYVADGLRRHLAHAEQVRVCSLPQLDLALLEEIQSADHLIVVDACVNALDAGLHWSVVEPDLNGWAAGSHHLGAPVFLGLLQILYGRRPSAWLVAVPGYDFALGERLSPAARRGAEKAIGQILDWLFVNRIVSTAERQSASAKRNYPLQSEARHE